MDYRDFLKLDLRQLDQALIEQPVIYDFFVGELPAVEKKKRQLKDELEELWAKLFIEIKTQLENEKKGRVVENDVKSRILLHPEYKAKLKELREVEAEYARLDHIKKTLNDRKDSLRMLVQLYGMSYFADVETKGFEELTENFKLKQLERGLMKNITREENE